MRPSITRLHQRMGEVAEFLRFGANMEQLRAVPAGAMPPAREIAAYLATPIWRRHIYASCIVSIYGAHERFVRDFCSDAAIVLARIYESYDKVPEKLRAWHERLSIERAKDILDGRTGDYAEFQLAVSNLHACLDGSMSINGDVFSASSSNYRSHTVRDIVARLGVELPLVNEDPMLGAVLATELNGFYSTVFGVVDDLADRRNEIAHGSDFEILDLGTLGAILKAVYGYDCWVYRMVAESLLRTAVLQRAVELGHIAKTYSSRETNVRSIASVANLSELVHSGEVLYLLHSGVLRQVIARSIQRERVDVEVAEPGGGPYGIDFAEPVKDGSRILRLPARHTSLATTLHLALREKPTDFAPIAPAATPPGRGEAEG